MLWRIAESNAYGFQKKVNVDDCPKSRMFVTATRLTGIDVGIQKKIHTSVTLAILSEMYSFATSNLLLF